jgi:hypothetical protein
MGGLSGGGSQGPSKSQLKAEQDMHNAELQMQQAMFNAQMTQQMEMMRIQQQQAEQARLDAIAERDLIMADQNRVLEEQKAESARLEALQVQAAIEAQNTSAQELRRQGEQKALDALSATSSAQQIADQAKKEKELQASMTAGTQATGAGAYNINASQQKSLVDLGAMAGTLPTTVANKGVGGTSQTSNIFQLPNTTGLQFGGT